MTDKDYVKGYFSVCNTDGVLEHFNNLAGAREYAETIDATPVDQVTLWEGLCVLGVYDGKSWLYWSWKGA